MPMPRRPEPASELTRRERRRYGPQLRLDEIGAAGQRRLKAARVLLIGMGGLGTPAAQYLAAAGIGRLGLIDRDHVSLSNLHRQILYRDNDIGAAKVEAAARQLASINPDSEPVPHYEWFNPHTALERLADYDLVCDGSDNFATRYLVADACHFARKPLVSAALGRFDGQLTCFRSYERDAAGQPLPGYRCLFPQTDRPAAAIWQSAPDCPPDNCPPAGGCAHSGVLGPVAGVMGTLMAVEVIKMLLGLGRDLTGRLLLYDGLNARFSEISYQWDPDNPLTGRAPRIRDLSYYNQANGG